MSIAHTIYVLVLITADGGIDTNLRFADLLSCRQAAHAVIYTAEADHYGDRIGDRYLLAKCISAKGLLKSSANQGEGK